MFQNFQLHLNAQNEFSKRFLGHDRYLIQEPNLLAIYDSYLISNDLELAKLDAYIFMHLNAISDGVYLLTEYSFFQQEKL